MLAGRKERGREMVEPALWVCTADLVTGSLVRVLSECHLGQYFSRMTILTLDWHLQEVVKGSLSHHNHRDQPMVGRPPHRRLMGSGVGRYTEAPEQLTLCHSPIITAIMIK